MIISPGPTEITSSYVRGFETRVQTLIQDAWARRNRSLIWDKIMGRKDSVTGRELFFWLIETARITKEGFGGNKRFDDLAANFLEIVNENAGAGLRLTANEFRDNQMANPDLRGMPALDFAASWARQVGGNAAYWPQQLLVDLLTNGTTRLGYDGVTYFNTAHPSGTSAPAYTNRISGKPLKVLSSGVYNLPQMVQNFADVVTTARGYLQANGLPRDVNFKYAVAGPDMQFALQQILTTKTYGGGNNGTNENVLSAYGIEPLILPELTEAGVVYLIAEALEDEGAAFMFVERDPYVLSTYTPDTLAELQRRKEFEWSFDGRNAGAYGHPYLAVRVEAT